MPDADDLERAVARTADLVLKLAALAERYEASGAGADRIAALRAAVRKGRDSLVTLGSGVDVGGLTPAVTAG